MLQVTSCRSCRAGSQGKTLGSFIAEHITSLLCQYHPPVLTVLPTTTPTPVPLPPPRSAVATAPLPPQRDRVVPLLDASSPYCVPSSCRGGVPNPNTNDMSLPATPTPPPPPSQVPVDAALAARVLAQKESEEAERSQIKALVLEANERDEAEQQAAAAAARAARAAAFRRGGRGSGQQSLYRQPARGRGAGGRKGPQQGPQLTLSQHVNQLTGGNQR